MNLLRRQSVWLGAGLAVGWLFCGPARAQVVTDPSATTEPDASLPSLTPAVSSGKSPVSFFRELLAMTPSERQHALRNRPPEKQQLILAKVEEYEAMPPDDRELRLQTTELRWYLVPLLSLPEAGRAAVLDKIPAAMRKLVENRLAQWQVLPPSLQERIREDDKNLQHYLQLAGSQPEMLNLYPPDLRKELEARVRRVNQFFELTSEEKEKALATLSEPERRQMEAALRDYEKLPSPQRAQCLRAFSKFAGLSAGDRWQFLVNAQRWQAMTPAERQQWRDLVRAVPQSPPLPPGFGLSSSPSHLSPARHIPPVATNGNGVQ